MSEVFIELLVEDMASGLSTIEFETKECLETEIYTLKVTKRGKTYIIDGISKALKTQLEYFQDECLS